MPGRGRGTVFGANSIKYSDMPVASNTRRSGKHGNVDRDGERLLPMHHYGNTHMPGIHERSLLIHDEEELRCVMEKSRYPRTVEFFRFCPLRWVDDVAHAVGDYVTDAVEVLEREVIKEEGTIGYDDLLEKVLDKMPKKKRGKTRKQVMAAMRKRTRLDDVFNDDDENEYESNSRNAKRMKLLTAERVANDVGVSFDAKDFREMDGKVVRATAKASKALQKHLRGIFDVNLDKMEMYLLKNVFRIPEDLNYHPNSAAGQTQAVPRPLTVTENDLDELTGSSAAASGRKDEGVEQYGDEDCYEREEQRRELEATIRDATAHDEAALDADIKGMRQRLLAAQAFAKRLTLEKKALTSQVTQERSWLLSFPLNTCSF